ncbi:MAG: hypothetical protein GY719_33895 [bacterium]|nr:hypothetical protein [bacterium]
MLWASTSFAHQVGEEASDSTSPEERASFPAKAGTFGARLLIPLYIVDTQSTTGPTTQYAIRNESTESVDVDVSYYETSLPQAPQREDTLTLGPKAIVTVDVRSVANLAVDGDGFARGYIVFEPTDGESPLSGDYFQIDNAGNFASGSRMVNIDPDSRGYDLCTRFSMRFLDSALAFDSGTIYTVWFEAAEPHVGTAFSYSVFDLAGPDSLLDNTFVSNANAFQVAASTLRFIVGAEFGAIEFEFPVGTVGHISAVMSALGRLSVGYEATCLDP